MIRAIHVIKNNSLTSVTDVIRMKDRPLWVKIKTDSTHSLHGLLAPLKPAIRELVTLQQVKALTRDIVLCS